MDVTTKLLCFMLVVLGVLCQTLGISRPTAIKLENNEYTNVLVAIHEDVPEDKNLIDKIKTMFTEASSYMYTGTRKRAFFKDIKILIPSTWTDDPAYSSPTSQIYTNADVVVTGMTPRYRDRPYSRTFSGCGQQGIRIHLTPKFLTSPSSRHVYGPAGRVLVHEWGHFRWGVFDEYPVEGEQEFYFSPTTGKYEVVRCNIHMYGQIAVMDANGRPVRPLTFCRESDLDKVTGRYPDGCHFHAVTRGARTKGISASIMDRQEIESIVNFCDDDVSDQKKVHNYEAPNRQNRMCGQRSTWAVISESEDFRGGRNPPRDGADTTPTFTLVKAARTRRVALVLDASGSMTVKTPTFTLVKAARTRRGALDLDATGSMTHLPHDAHKHILDYLRDDA
ncbi:calcium-activated chloride channel regulator 1-like [Gigantopelta aegis]|uniref:calcium-activated chloride channel regulator 1-like n=1 Tax=Gigantopelta aegis TaxID=1735272 RepID=UPI001B887460|nr:calcium-activated chloride channel regulator 1-like [Gigantopelta aegis]